jgi:hypothetical protein
MWLSSDVTVPVPRCNLGLHQTRSARYHNWPAEELEFLRVACKQQGFTYGSVVMLLGPCQDVILVFTILVRRGIIIGLLKHGSPHSGRVMPSRFPTTPGWDPNNTVTPIIEETPIRVPRCNLGLHHTRSARYHNWPTEARFTPQRKGNAESISHHFWMGSQQCGGSNHRGDINSRAKIQSWTSPDSFGAVS